MPFGEEILVTSGDPRFGVPGYGADFLRQKFTGKERDAETGLDYFGARYLSGAQGRFTGTDAPFADQHPRDPQSWALYTYVRNNPLGRIDPTGQAQCQPGASNDPCAPNSQPITEPLAIPQASKSPTSAKERLSAMLTMDFWIGLLSGGTQDDSGNEEPSNTPEERTGQETADNLRSFFESPIGQFAVAMIPGGKGRGGARPNGTSDRLGKAFTKKGRAEVIEQNMQGNGGQTVCANCGIVTAPAKQSKKGVPTPPNETRVDHIYPRSEGGSGTPPNGQLLCSNCNLKKSNKLPEKH